MNHSEIIAELFRLQDKDYAAFQGKLIPTTGADRIIGVRTPELRALAKRVGELHRQLNCRASDVRARELRVDSGCVHDTDTAAA